MSKATAPKRTRPLIVFTIAVSTPMMDSDIDEMVNGEAGEDDMMNNATVEDDMGNDDLINDDRATKNRERQTAR